MVLPPLASQLGGYRGCDQGLGLGGARAFREYGEREFEALLRGGCSPRLDG